MWIAYAVMWVAVSAAVIAAMFITKSDIDIFFLLIPAFCGKMFKFTSEDDSSEQFNDYLK